MRAFDRLWSCGYDSDIDSLVLTFGIGGLLSTYISENTNSEKGWNTMELKVLFSEECFSCHEEYQQGFLKANHVFPYDDTTRIVDLFRFLFDKSIEVLRDGETCYCNIEEEYENRYGPLAEITNRDLLRFFLIKQHNRFISLWDETVTIKGIANYLRIGDTITLYFEGSFGGEGYFDEIELKGMRFYYHSKEQNHRGRPHIHVKKGQKWISVDLFSFEILEGHFVKAKYENCAIDCIKENQRAFIKGWNDYSNGIKVNLDQYICEGENITA